ncbi:MAG TPA: hypothetical protein VHO48_12375, partial [Anaerolineaceae bacterium]|nr:hypothetical protein [Anaerolineaceae bacterium]
MPGIMTLVNDAGLDQPCVDLQRMIQRVVRRPDLSIDTYQGDFAAVAGIHLDLSKTIATCPGIVLAMAGEVVEFAALRQRLSDCGQDVRSIHTQSELLLELYRVFGLDSICGLNGAYAVIIWEPDLRRLTLVRDRFGLIGLYYWQANGLL